MESEIKQLRQALIETARVENSPENSSTHVEELTIPSTWTSQLSALPVEAPILTPTDYGLSIGSQTGPMTDQAALILDSPSSYRMLGDVCLTNEQVEQRFSSYFSRYHVHVPFEMTTKSANDVFIRSPLLFWVICAVTSSKRIQFQLSPLIKTMVADIVHAHPQLIETAHALLILCLYPFKISGMREDPSLMYSSIATQICLQLGHPSSSQHASTISTPRNDHKVKDDRVKTSTLLACFIQNRIYSGYQGIPATTLAHPKLLRAFDDPLIDPNLSSLGRIYHLLGDAIVAIGANGPSPSGMLEPSDRLAMINVYGEQLSELRQRYFPDMAGMVAVSYWHARLQIWSFALLDDMVLSDDLLAIFQTAEHEAYKVIELCYDVNLAAAPYHFRRAICFGGFVLVKILRSPFCRTKPELLADNIERARQALSATASAPDDIICKACRILEELPYLEDKKRTPPISSRMSASMMFDMLRIYWENWYDRNLPEEPSFLDLDAIEWDSLVL